VRYRTLGLVLLALIVAGLVGLASCESQGPAEPAGIELDVDIDRSKTRAPLKTAKPAPAPKTRKAWRR
jgi:hypothetical protein